MKTIQDLFQKFKSRKEVAIINRSDFRRNIYYYNDLYDLILKLCTYLDDLGLKKGNKIFIWSYNSIEWSLIFLACAIKGIIIVPIDFLAKEDFIIKIYNIVKPKHFFKTKYKPNINLNIDITNIEDLIYKIKPLNKCKNIPNINTNDIVEIVFTSGTTGEPKGVVITNENLCSNLISMSLHFKLNKKQKFLSVLPLSHLFEQNPGFLMVMNVGASVVYIKTIKPSNLLTAMKEEKITNMVTVPRLLNSLTESIKKQVELQNKTKLFNKMLKFSYDKPLFIKKILFNKVHKKIGENFLYFVSGGAYLNEDLQDFWENLGFKIIQGYGLTECSPVLCANFLNIQKKGYVGKALPNISIRIKDGEIQAKGKNITQGYYNNKKQTDYIFDNGWFKTGDIGEIDNDGFIKIKGRSKDVIVTGSGMNVFPEDIEKILLEDSDVKDCCVLGIKRLNEEIVYAVLILNNSKSDIKKIINNANNKLASSQQIIGYSVWKENDFPRTTTMKIKKNIVAEKLNKNSSKKISNTSSNKLYNLLSLVCKVDIGQIKQSSSLSKDLNLDSIGKIELVSYIEQEYNIDFSDELINQYTTVSKLEKLILEKVKIPIKKIDIFKKFTLNKFSLFLRTLNNILTYPLQRRIIKLNVKGLENLKNVSNETIFVSNHITYLDAPTIYRALPFKLRNKVFTAMHTEYFEEEKNKFLLKLKYFYVTYFVGAYPFPRTRNFKKNIQVTGSILDKGYNILFFPEGKHSIDGKIDTFKQGIGFIISELNVNIIPVKIDGIFGCLDNGIHKKNVTVTFGKPLFFYNKSSIEITKILEEEVKKL
jgi:long-chain acyl-CoA synthetase